MSEQNPYEKLGVTENASFEEIQVAKQRLIQQHQNDSKLLEGVETAYDAIIMERLRMRQEGKIKVPDRIRFPEKIEVPSKTASMSVNTLQLGCKDFFDTPSRTELFWSIGVFGVLMGLAAFDQSSNGSLVQLVTAIGFIANIYFLNRKEHRFARSLLIALVGLIGGVSLGTAMAGWLGIARGTMLLSVEQFASFVTLLLFWLSSIFFR